MTRLLLDRIADRHRPSVLVSLSPTLVARRTTGPPPAGPATSVSGLDVAGEDRP